MMLLKSGSLFGNRKAVHWKEVSTLWRLKPILYPESSGFLVGTRRDSGILEFQLPQDFCGKTMQPVMGQPIKEFKLFKFPRVSLGTHQLTKKPENSGYEIGL